MMPPGADRLRPCEAAPRAWCLLTLLALVLLLVKASPIEAARNKCDRACRECKTSCASQKLNCLTHTRADLGSALRDCASGRSRRSCRRLARQRFMLARSECKQSATVCRSCCTASGTSDICTTTTTTTSTTTTTTLPTSAIRTVFLIVMENTDWSSIKGSSSAPYINSLLSVAAHAEQYYNPPNNHPSLPNYLWLEAGTNFGISSDPNPPQRTSSPHLANMLDAAGISWKTYQEDQGQGAYH